MKEEPAKTVYTPAHGKEPKICDDSYRTTPLPLDSSFLKKNGGDMIKNMSSIIEKTAEFLKAIVNNKNYKERLGNVIELAKEKLGLTGKPTISLNQEIENNLGKKKTPKNKNNQPS